MGTNFMGAYENVIEWSPGNDFATVTFSRQKLANRVRKLAEKYPDEVKIIADGPKNGGYLYAHIPSDWVKISPPRQLSEEERNRLRERARLFGVRTTDTTDEIKVLPASEYEDEEIFNDED